MRISIFGLGYVGAVTAACLAREGFDVTGIDPNETKVGIINAGRSPIIEADLEPLISAGVKQGRLRAVSGSREAILGSEVSLVCVGTPSKGNGSLDLRYIERVCREIGLTLEEKDSYHLVVFRSTMLPGTTEEIVIPLLEKASGKAEGKDFGVVFNPEFMRESTSVHDYYNPPKTVIGSRRERDAEAVAGLYRGLVAPLVLTSLRVAEMVKYVDNAFHALKVTFGNEIGNVCKALGIDSHEVIDIFCLDTKLNLSPYYLKPGFAFGGSCLPKDLNALTHRAVMLDVQTPLIQSIHASNELQIRNAVNRVIAYGKKKVGVLGFAFKAGTDDLRNSPIVELIETLLGKGYAIKVYDSAVSMAKLFGANKEYIENRIPHIADLLVSDITEIIDHAEMIVIGNKSPEFVEILSSLREEQCVLDLVRISRNVRTRARYDGICW
jgi:GDP-mannose 6-dehydrogenase